MDSSLEMLGFTLVKRHDDGDETLRGPDGRLYVSTTDGRYFREAPPPEREAPQRAECIGEVRSLLAAADYISVFYGEMGGHISDKSLDETRAMLHDEVRQRYDQATARYSEGMARVQRDEARDVALVDLVTARHGVQDALVDELVDAAFDHLLTCACDPNRPLRGQQEK